MSLVHRGLLGLICWSPRTDPIGELFQTNNKLCSNSG